MALAGLAGATGTAILVVEHKTWLLGDLADEIALMSGGRIVFRGPTAAMLDDERLADLGVEPPPVVRLRRLLVERGLALEPSLFAGEGSS
jgi:energy-coupling factor transporter ATP-binding protein EcfA2